MSILWVFLLVACIGKKNNNEAVNYSPINMNNQETEDTFIYPIENNFDEKKLTNENYDYLFVIESSGVYLINESFNFDKIINQNVSVVSCYENLLFFINNNWYNFVLYNYITKEIINTSFRNIKQMNYISENKLDIIGNIPESENIIITVDYFHNNINKTINYEFYNEIKFIFRGGEFDSISDNGLIYIVDIFDKKICFDLTNIMPSSPEPEIEIYYNNYHNVYFVTIRNSFGHS